MTILGSTSTKAKRARQPRTSFGVAWPTVLTFAVVMAFADGYWLTSFQGAVGAVGASQSPYASWWRESAVMVPLFVAGILAAFAVATRLFGPALRTVRARVAATLLTVAAGTMVATAELAVASAHNYKLESSQVRMMATMGANCRHGCVAQQLHATLIVQLRAAWYGSMLILLTNLVLAFWLVALAGGRLNISTRREPVLDSSGASDATRASGSRVRDVHILLTGGLLGSAAIHAAVAPEHFREWLLAGVFFVVLTAAQIAVGYRLFTRPDRNALLATAAISALPLVVWLYSRTLGLPFGPDPGVAEQVGVPDIVAGVLEVATLVGALGLLRGDGWLRRRPEASPHIRAFGLVAVLAVTVIGLAGTQPTWLADFSGPGGPGMVMTHSTTPS